MVGFAQPHSCSIAKPTPDAPTAATLWGSMGVSGATWTRRLRDTLARGRRLLLFVMRSPSPCLVQLLGGGGGEPAWGYCGAWVSCGASVANRAIWSSERARVFLQRLVMHLRCNAPSCAQRCACARIMRLLLSLMARRSAAVDYEALRVEARNLFASKIEEVRGSIATMQKAQRAAEQALDMFVEASHARRAGSW